MVWCLDSPGFGGSEIDLLRVLDMIKDDSIHHVVAHGNPLDPRLENALINRGITTIQFKAGSRFYHAPPAWFSASKLLLELNEAYWIIWMHHCDACRWLQERLAANGARYVLAERISPSSKKDFEKSRLTIPLKRRSVRRCQKVAILARTQMPIYCDIFGVSREKLSFVPNSRDIDRLSTKIKLLKSQKEDLRKQLQLPNDKPVIICVGSLDARKGQAVLVNSLARLRNAGIDTYLCLVGTGPDQRTIAELCARLLPDSHKLIGYQSDPTPWLAASDIFALPSRAEGLSGALIEAMAAGLPCIATDIPGNRELVREGETGLLVPVNSVEAMAKAIRRMLCDAALAARCAVNGHELVAREYDESCEKRAWLDLINNLMATA